MTHRAERRRRANSRRLEDERIAAEEYSQRLNWHWDSLLFRIFRYSGQLEPLDLTYCYDELQRQLSGSL